MNSKTTWAGVVAAITGILSYIASVPPELQEQVPMLFPEEHRGTIGLWLRVISGFSVLALSHFALDKPKIPK